MSLFIRKTRQINKRRLLLLLPFLLLLFLLFFPPFFSLSSHKLEDGIYYNSHQRQRRRKNAQEKYEKWKMKQPSAPSLSLSLNQPSCFGTSSNCNIYAKERERGVIVCGHGWSWCRRVKSEWRSKAKLKFYSSESPIMKKTHCQSS